MRSRQERWHSYWQELTDILLPNMADFTRSSRDGRSRERQMYDGTPRRACRDLSSTLDGLMKPKTSNWFEPTVDEDEDAERSDDAKLWFEVVRDRMYRAIYRQDARFIQRSGEVDQMLAAIGWGCLWIEENRAFNGLLFRSFHPRSVAFDEGEDGVIDAVGIERRPTARQALSLYQKYGVPVPSAVSDAADKHANKTFTIIQLVLPRDDRDASRISAGNMPYMSAIFDASNDVMLKESGFIEFPAAIPRWDTAPGEIYPRSPGMIALPDARTLQAMGKTILVAGQRAVDPPIWVANDAIMSPLRTFPGSVSVIDVQNVPGNQAVGAFPVANNLPLGREMQDDYRRSVEAAFFKHVFNLPVQTRSMTATEIMERKAEFIRAIGPVFGRLETDYIGHIVSRAFGIMDRAGAFPPRPDVLINKKITFRFQSPIQQARRQLEVAGLARALEVLNPLVQFQPEIMDNFDGDAIARDAPTWAGMTTRWLRTMEDRDQIRQDRQKAQHDATMQQTMKPTSEALKNVVDAQNQAQGLPQQPQQPIQPGPVPLQ